MTKFEELNKINVNGYTEEKNGLTYLSWANAWAEFKKVCPDATYEIVKFDGKPYVYDEALGYMCYTKVTVDGLTHEMWLPVMDGANKAMKATAYTYKTKYGEKTCEAATMFDINKTIMRCLVKNLAMFGLGLYIYAGEDLPEEVKIEEAKKKEPIGEERAKAFGKQLADWGIKEDFLILLLKNKGNSLATVTEEQMSWVNRNHEKILEQQTKAYEKGEENENKETAVTK